MILTFTVMKDKLISGEKTQTIRKNCKWKIGDKLDIWWGYPVYRNKSIKELGIAKVIDIEYKYGSELVRKDAINDGFTNLRDLLNTLIFLYRMSKTEILEHKWVIIRWEWIEKYRR